MKVFDMDLKREVVVCPDCGVPLQFGSVCKFCPQCGYSPCGKLVSTIGGFGVMLSCLVLVVLL